MGFKCLDDCVAYQFAIEFKTEVYALIKGSREASRDFKFRDQLAGAASDISGCQAEGFARYRPAEIANFLTYALASLAEAEDRLGDGILRGYFLAADCAKARTWARRCRGATRGWLASELRILESRRQEGRKEPRSPGGKEQRSPGGKEQRSPGGKEPRSPERPGPGSPGRKNP
jgi:four helix bundle protein